MGPIYNRIDVTHALDDLILREDGITFQRLARRLFREQHIMLLPYHEHNDLGQDAIIYLDSVPVTILSSLDTSLSKIKGDIERILEYPDTPKKIYFVTPKKVSNQTSQKWKNVILAKYKLELIIFERSWVVDECLRPQNTFIVFQELQIPFSHIDDMDDVIIGSLLSITPEKQSISQVTSISYFNEEYLAWYVLPSEGQKEKILLQRIGEVSKGPINVGNGATVDCLFHDNNLLVSWIFLNKQNSWKIWVNKYNRELELKEKNVVLDAVNLKSRVVLSKLMESPCLIFVSDSKSFGMKINALFLENMRTIEYELPNLKMDDCIVCHSNNQVYAVIDRTYSVDIFSLNKNGWHFLGSITEEVLHNRMIIRMSFGIDNDNLIFIIELQDYGITTLLFNLTRKESNNVWQVCPHGKFPDIVISGNRRIISWIGGPSLPEQYQGYRRSVDFEHYREVLYNIRQETDKLMKARLGSQKYLEYQTERSHLVGLWSPVWLGILNTKGVCVKSYGPLGYGCRDNFSTTVSSTGKRGLLSWRCGEDMYNCAIFAREFIFP